MHSTLQLNADGMPVNLLPLSTMGWEDAIKNIWMENVDVLHYYEEWFVHSPSITMQVPAVIILKEQVHVKRRLSVAGLSNSLVFLRDGYECQYCNTVFPKKQLTMDHVLPKKYGGRTKWENVASACGKCNGMRGHNQKIQPKTKPFRPDYGHLVKMMRKFNIVIPHATWNYYMGWHDDKVRVIDPRSGKAPDHIHDDLSFE